MKYTDQQGSAIINNFYTRLRQNAQIANQKTSSKGHGGHSSIPDYAGVGAMLHAAVENNRGRYSDAVVAEALEELASSYPDEIDDTRLNYFSSNDEVVGEQKETADQLEMNLEEFLEDYQTQEEREEELRRQEEEEERRREEEARERDEARARAREQAEAAAATEAKYKTPDLAKAAGRSAGTRIGETLGKAAKAVSGFFKGLFRR